MQYTAVEIKLDSSKDENSEILVALLDSLNYEGITEKEEGLVIAYIPTESYDKSILQSTLLSINTLNAVIISEEIIQPQNWNKEWEKNFDPVFISDKCVIRAPFHQAYDNYEFVITIEPKMSFGTGHHNTTSLMISQILNLDCNGLQILDMGCGTGVLGILAKLKGASEVVAIDIDEWAFENTIENAERNNVEMQILMGGVEQIPDKEFDIILANINRNILLEQCSCYFKHLKADGKLFISGILSEDIDVVKQHFGNEGFVFDYVNESGNWQLMAFKK